jgi:tetratricopeptide (TPR) repeat protein
MDLLDFQAGELYFDEPIDPAASAAIEEAAGRYGENGAEQLLLRAYFLEPEHPLVLVALYRYFYYQHRLPEALLVSERVLRLYAARLGLPIDWRQLDEAQLAGQAAPPITLLRFYLLALKGAGFIELRLGRFDAALGRLEKVVELDGDDRLGAMALIEVAREATAQPQPSAQAQSYQRGESDERN